MIWTPLASGGLWEREEVIRYCEVFLKESSIRSICSKVFSSYVQNKFYVLQIYVLYLLKQLH